jgi:hypothetical protein
MSSSLSPSLLSRPASPASCGVSSSQALLATALAALLTACGGGGGGGGGGSEGGAADANASPSVGAATAALPAPRLSARLFFTGHSLTDNPLPDDVVAIADSLRGASEPSQYNQQNIIGSPLRVRTRGNDGASSGWSGYRMGKNRDGQNMDVLAEIAQPRTVAGAYDALVLTERHDLVTALLFEDTVRYARHFHDRVAAAKPGAVTYFYQSWQSIRDKSAPADWVAYERAASPVWTCMATRINQSLAAEGRTDRVVPIRAGSALAELVERATTAAVPGVSGGGVGATVDRLIYDGVHPTPLGMYYMSLVTYASVYRRSPVGAWRPADVSADQAASLQTLAWEFVSSRESEPAQNLDQCAATMRQSFCAVYGDYTGATGSTATCQARFSAPGHPFDFNAATDRGHWLPSP